MLLRNIILLCLLSVGFLLPMKAGVRDSRVDSLLNVLDYRLQSDEFSIGELHGRLYLKQYTNAKRKNFLLNFIPDMTRFDKGEKEYLTELFYDVKYFEYAVPDVRRRASLTTHRHGSGEMERVLAYVCPDIYSDKLFDKEYISPLHKSNSNNYRYSIDKQYSDTAKINRKWVKLLYEQRFDNIKLLNKGWVLLDEKCAVREFYAEGWNEQERFKAFFRMGQDGLERYAVEEMSILLNYNFAGNKLDVYVNGMYDYSYMLPLSMLEKKTDKYNLTGSHLTNNTTLYIGDKKLYAQMFRKKPLTITDSLFYVKKGVYGNGGDVNDSIENKNDIAYWLWTVGDGMISSHTMDWGNGRVKMSPIINPSYLSYSSSRGLSYRLAFNIYSTFKNGRWFNVKPMVGYNFKQNYFYWDVGGEYYFDPLHLGSINLDVGLGNRIYSSVILDQIKDVDSDSLDFDKLNLDYFSNFYMNLGVQREISNGLRVLLGVNFHRRSLLSNSRWLLDTKVYDIKDVYTGFAPHIRVFWQPGTYYYIQDNRKINVGSNMPRFELDIERGISGVMGSSSSYTRTEVDIQYKYNVNESDVLYMRAGGGGFFNTKDVYFVDYAFLKHNNLPVDRSDELGGVFQLLASEWYSSANKYLRANFTYESPFLVLQKFLPRVNFIKNEHFYFNLLVMSHLLPYSELGYGLETPYIDMGVFVSMKNRKFHQFGYKFTISLFRD